jgi:hypothetical protein
MRKQINPSANYWRTSTQRAQRGKSIMSTQPSKINPGVNPRTSASEIVKSRIPAGGVVDRSQYENRDPVQKRDERQGQA